jgi:hypothetical protein
MDTWSRIVRPTWRSGQTDLVPSPDFDATSVRKMIPADALRHLQNEGTIPEEFVVKRKLMAFFRVARRF